MTKCIVLSNRSKLCAAHVKCNLWRLPETIPPPIESPGLPGSACWMGGATCQQACPLMLAECRWKLAGYLSSMPGIHRSGKCPNAETMGFSFEVLAVI
jgi:hypothetical protein